MHPLLCEGTLNRQGAPLPREVGGFGREMVLLLDTYFFLSPFSRFVHFHSSCTAGASCFIFIHLFYNPVLSSSYDYHPCTS